MMNFKQAYTEILKDLIPYFRKYTYDRPIIMSLDTYHKTKQLGVILNKAICHLVSHYMDYQDIMPLDKRVLEILSICSKYPFSVGTYRTDFLIDENNQLKIIEMTTRQPLNGYFLSGVSAQIGFQQACQYHIHNATDEFSGLIDYFQNDFFGSKKIRVIKGYDRLGDIKIYSRLFELTDEIDFKVIELDHLADEIEDLKGARVIEELNFSEIKSLPNHLIEKLTEARVHNDFRNIFLIHDKRFFQLLTTPRFLNSALSGVECDLLSEFTIPSYSFNTHPEVFKEAMHNKEAWIIKPISFGKSEGVKAGSVTSQEDWELSFHDDVVKNMVLQPMIPQRKFRGTIGEEIRDDYVAGTLLYFNNEYYGPGIYRASSFVVTNVKDDRKVAQVVADGTNTEFMDVTI